MYLFEKKSIVYHNAKMFSVKTVLPPQLQSTLMQVFFYTLCKDENKSVCVCVCLRVCLYVCLSCLSVARWKRIVKLNQIMYN